MTTQTNLQESAAQKSSFTWAIWLVAIGLLALLGYGLITNTATRPEVGQPVPGFALTLYDNYGWQSQTEVTLADFEGKIVVLNFWASWCVPCHEEADELEALWKQYAPQDVVLLGAAYVDDQQTALAFLERYAITYPNGPDLRSEIAKDYDVVKVPETFVIDQNGELVLRQSGTINLVELEATLNQLVQSNP